MPKLPDLQIVNEVCSEFLQDFGSNYAKGYATALVQDMINSESKQKTQESQRSLLRNIPVAPELEGPVLVSQGGQQTKPAYWKVRPDWNIDIWPSEEAMNAALDEKDEKKARKRVTVFNPWGYRPYSWVPTSKEFSKRRGGPRWVSDKERGNCTKCEAKFNATRRRHHCRTCGDIFCEPCSNEKWKLGELGYTDPAKVCVTCYDILNTKGIEGFTFPEPADTFGLRISHSQRPSRFIMCADKKQCDAWSSAIRSCSRHAASPANPNTILAAAFEKAHRYSWNWQGPWWDRWRVFGSETEMLTVLLAFVVNRRCLERVLNSVEVPTFARPKAMATTKNQLRNLVSLSLSLSRFNIFIILPFSLPLPSSLLYYVLCSPYTMISHYDMNNGMYGVQVQNTVNKTWPLVSRGVEESEGKVRGALAGLLTPIREAKYMIMDVLRSLIRPSLGHQNTPHKQYSITHLDRQTRAYLNSIQCFCFMYVYIPHI